MPRRHWHQNDPGVVPNVLYTGAGAPSGITVYEGTLLPPVRQVEVRTRSNLAVDSKVSGPPSRVQPSSVGGRSLAP